MAPRNAVTPPDFRPDTVDLRTASFAAHDPRRFEGWLSPVERERAARFAYERERTRFVISRGLLRELLAPFAGSPPAALEIVADPDGKPRLGGRCGQGRVRFNVSHSGDLWACAVTLHREVGLDVEEHRTDRGEESIAKRDFAPAERALLASLPAGERTAAFHRIWTRKEAWLKAKGVGITIPLDTVDVSGSAPPGWTLLDLDVGPGFSGALCVEGGPFTVRRRAS